ncbi:hypothetical protein FORC31_p231 (plasmid) [Escherichia coli]|nr:hypothetical protein FORC31_p231 [Escherichia coli]
MTHITSEQYLINIVNNKTINKIVNKIVVNSVDEYYRSDLFM